MKTDELVTMLATGVEAVDPRAPARRCAAAVAAGALIAAVIMAVWLGVRANIVEDFAVPMLWAKFFFVAWLAVGGWIAAMRLARPGATLDPWAAGRVRSRYARIDASGRKGRLLFSSPPW